MTKHDDWLHAAEEVRSFRQMYALSLEIAAAADEPQLRAAADAVVRTLKRVVDKPIASSHRLREAQLKFDRLKVHARGTGRRGAVGIGEDGSLIVAKKRCNRSSRQEKKPKNEVMVERF